MVLVPSGVMVARDAGRQESGRGRQKSHFRSGADNDAGGRSTRKRRDASSSING